MSKALLVLCLLTVALLAGCGGDPGPDWPEQVSPFAGFWKGAWTDSTNNQTGTAEVVIRTDGKGSGMVTNTTLGLQGNASVAISSKGSATFTYQYAEDTYLLNGTLFISEHTDKSVHLVGLLKEYYNDAEFGTVSVDLVKQ